MGKIVISTNVSLDGVIQDPDGQEGFKLGGWFVQGGGKDLEEWGKIEYAEALRTAALLLGRHSDEWFAARWVSKPGEWADRLNSLPKYVVSSTLEDPRWTNVTVLKGNVVDEVTRLKQELDGDIVVYASYQLGRTLIEHDLVDELRLFVFPVVLGAGERLFGVTSGKKPIRLVRSQTVGDSLVFLTYQMLLCLHSPDSGDGFRPPPAVLVRDQQWSAHGRPDRRPAGSPARNQARTRQRASGMGTTITRSC